VLQALLEKDPARRADAETADRMLRTVAAGGRLPETAVPASPVGDPAADRGKRRWPILAGSLAAAVAVAAGAGFALHKWDRPAAEAAGPGSAVSPSPEATVDAPSVPARPPASPSAAPSRSPASAGPSAGASRSAKPTTGAGPVDSAVWFRLVNRNSKKCVDVRGGVAGEHTPVQQLTCGTTKGQDFRLIATSDGNVRIASRLDSFKSLDVTDQSPADFALIQLWPYNGRQQWRAVPEDAGFYHFVNKFSDKCLDVPNASTDDAIQLDQFSCNGTPAQSFQLQKA
jgi:hypothetical protein